MTCVWASTTAWALKHWWNDPSEVFMILDSGSVKFRCAEGFGLNGSRPSRGGRGLRPSASSSARRAVSRSLASPSSACLASRIASSRPLRSRSRSGQLIAAPVGPVQRVLPGVDPLGLLEPAPHVAARHLDLGSSSAPCSPSARNSSPCAAKRSRAASSRPTPELPSPTSRASRHNRSDCTNSPDSASRCRVRNRPTDR